MAVEAGAEPAAAPASTTPSAPPTSMGFRRAPDPEPLAPRRYKLEVTIDGAVGQRPRPSTP